MLCNLSRTAVLLCVVGAALACSSLSSRPNVHDEAALGAARWLQAVGITSDEGRSWPIEPDRSAAASDDLYSGGAGYRYLAVPTRGGR